MFSLLILFSFVEGDTNWYIDYYYDPEHTTYTECVEEGERIVEINIEAMEQHFGEIVEYQIICELEEE